MLEILLVIGLLMILSGVLVTGAARLTREEPLTPEDVFWKAAGAARKQALLSGRDVRLSYSVTASPEGGAPERVLLARGVDGTQQRFPFVQTGELSVNFLSGQAGASSILIGGQLIETQTVPFVTFYGDGTCSAFRVQLRTGGPATILAIDPWTCAPLLAAAEAGS